MDVAARNLADEVSQRVGRLPMSRRQSYANGLTFQRARKERTVRA
jgi:hypothetical protein